MMAILSSCCFGAVTVANDAVVPANTLAPISLENVVLLPGSQQFRAEQANLEYLLMLSTDSFLWNFRTTSGINASSISPAQPYRDGWAGEEMHHGAFTGHFLSASALAWASTKNGTLQRKMEYLVQELRKCQLKNGNGYVSAIPSSIFDSLEYNTSFYARTH